MFEALSEGFLVVDTATTFPNKAHINHGSDIYKDKIESAIKYLGTKYLLHKSNMIKPYKTQN